MLHVCSLICRMWQSVRAHRTIAFMKTKRLPKHSVWLFGTCLCVCVYVCCVWAPSGNCLRVTSFCMRMRTHTWLGLFYVGAPSIRQKKVRRGVKCGNTFDLKTWGNFLIIDDEMWIFYLLDHSSSQVLGFAKLRWPLHFHWWLGHLFWTSCPLPLTLGRTAAIVGGLQQGGTCLTADHSAQCKLWASSHPRGSSLMSARKQTEADQKRLKLITGSKIIQFCDISRIHWNETNYGTKNRM